MKTATKTFKKRSSEGPKEDRFISKILENLDQVKSGDWEAYADLSSLYPTNLFSNKRYSGINVLALMVDGMAKGFKSLKYATFKSISEAGGRLKKGSKGCLIEFFTFIYKDKETNRNYTLQEVIYLSPEQQKRVHKIACPKTYVVFNSELIENISEINFDIQEVDEPEAHEIEEKQNCENFVSMIQVNGNLKLKFALNEIAFYSPVFDFIQLPNREYFISSDKYYSTLFHEIIHWTGHTDRLARELKGHKDKESYSFEELVAEMGSMLICLQFGILGEFINSVRYLKGWATCNSQDRETAIRKAFTQSKKSKKYLENLQNK